MSETDTTDRRIPPSFAEFPKPTAAAPPPASREPQPGAGARMASVFAADRVGAHDALSPTLARLAELALHRAAETPISIGLIGGAGAGKSSALAALTRRIQALAKAAAAGGPYVSRAIVLQVSGHELDDEPEAVLAARLHQALEHHDANFARESAADAVHSTSDPRALAHAANERLDEARRRVDTERQALEDISSRRARLIDTMLYETAGSQVDAYARSRRSGIESALRTFGIAGNDPIRSYKDEVNQLAQSRGGASRAGFALRALWAYRGQIRWLVLAVIFLLIAWGCGYLERDHAWWLESIRGSGETARPLADWLQTHLNWLATLRSAAIVIAVLCVLANLWRAFRFVQPVFRGATLLHRDVAERGQDLDSRLSHQTRRVDNLARDVDALAARAVEAEKRAGPIEGAAAIELPPFHASASDRIRTEAARAFFASISDRLAATEGSGPQRIVVAIDGIENVASSAIDTLAALLGRPGFVAIVTTDPARIGTERLARVIQVPFTLPPTDHTRLVDRLLGRAPPAARAAEPLDARQSSLDTPVSDGEAELLAALAPLAGPAPRGVKRFVNLYRLARLDAPDDLAPLAFTLALDAGGAADEIAAVEGSLAGTDERAPFILQQSAGTRLAAALAAAEQAEGKKLTLGSMRRARDIARTWSFGPSEDDAF